MGRVLGERFEADSYPVKTTKTLVPRLKETRRTADNSP